MHLPKENIFEITLQGKALDFIFFNQKKFPGIFFLQINFSSQEKLLQEADQENLLPKTEIRLNIVQDALLLLDKIRKVSSSEKKEKLRIEIKNNYLSQLEKMQEEVKDPTISLCLDIIQKNLQEVIHPEQSLSQLYHILTPSEIQIAEFVRMGKTTRDIADALTIAQKTVENHRNKLREKLGIRNKRINLRSYLIQRHY